MPEEVAEIQEYELLSDYEDEGEGNENDELLWKNYSKNMISVFVFFKITLYYY